jgi:hypothetical protein
MAIPTLNEMITAAISAAEEPTSYYDAVDAEVQQEKVASDATLLDLADIEKLASACEFIGQRGIESFVKTAAGISLETNDKATAIKAVDTIGKEKGTHNPALASNEAAIKYTKKEKAKSVSPFLSAVLDENPFGDNALKKNLSHTEGDKNIHSKAAHDKDALMAELNRRVALKQQGVADVQ